MIDRVKAVHSFAIEALTSRQRRQQPMIPGTATLSVPTSLAELESSNLWDVYILLTDSGIAAESLLQAGVLHSVMNQTDVSSDEIKERFGRQVADIVTETSLKASIISRSDQLRDFANR